MKIQIREFLQKAEKCPVIDVRTSAEFCKGHLPGAINLPLFSNEERAVVGTKYKKASRDEAVAESLNYIAAKVDHYLDEIAKLNLSGKELLIYCWRGGMRSAGMAHLLAAEGYLVARLEGGYKAYRKEVLQSFEKPLNLAVVGGMTGSGKSDVLKAIASLGEQVVDLEGIAHHKGSAFGALGQPEQPSIEQFENELFAAFLRLDINKKIWLEDESQLIGRVRIPKSLFQQMRSAVVYKLELSRELRIERLKQEYTDFDTNQIITSIQNISRRLGGLAARKAIDAVQANDFTTAIEIVLRYYDKTYSYGLSKRKDQSIISIKLQQDEPLKAAEALLAKYK